MSNDDEFIRAAQEAIETHRDTFQKLRIAELEEQLADLQLAKSHLWADKQFLEAQCAALREALFDAREKAIRGERWTDDDKTVFALASDAGAALLKRLHAAEAVADAYVRYVEASRIFYEELAPALIKEGRFCK